MINWKNNTVDISFFQLILIRLTNDSNIYLRALRDDTSRKMYTINSSQNALL